jgi:hypothetical protein
MERVHGDNRNGMNGHMATEGAVNEQSEEHLHTAIGVEEGEDSRMPEAEQSNVNLVPCSLVEEDRHLVVAAWREAMDEGAYVPSETAVDGNPQDRLEDDEGGILLQGDCHLRLRDLVVQTSREWTFDRSPLLSKVLQLL